MAKSTVMSSNPGGTDDSPLYSKGKTPLDESYDLQDRMMELIGKGNNLSTNDRGAIYNNLTNLVGKDKAEKIMNHIYLFNQHPDLQKLPFEDRVKAFYRIGSNDKDVQGYIDKTRNLGYGVGPNLRRSFSQINQQVLSGEPDASGSTQNMGGVNKKIMIRVGK